MNLVDDHDAQVVEEPLLLDPARDEHHLERLGRCHEQVCRLAEEPLPLMIRSIAMPHEPAQADHLGIQPKPVRLVVEKRLDGRDVDRSHARWLVVDHLRNHRKHRRFGLAAGRRRQNDRVLSCEKSLACFLLHRPQARPSQP